MDQTDGIRPDWRPLPEMWSAPQAAHAYVPGYELIAFVLPDEPSAADGGGEIGWEVFTGPRLTEQVATGQAASFEEAKAKAEAAWRDLIR